MMLFDLSYYNYYIFCKMGAVQALAILNLLNIHKCYYYAGKNYLITFSILLDKRGYNMFQRIHTKLLYG